MFTHEEIIGLRRKFHQTPETGWLEFQTTVTIIDHLKEMGYDVHYGREIHSQRMGLPTDEEMKAHAARLDLKRDYDISEILLGYTGATAILDTGRPGPVVALRFDIDCNGVQEAEDEDHLPAREGFRSMIPSAMHACGHDGHAAIGLGVAAWIMEHQSTLKGRFILVFQPAEEGVRGARSMVEKGILKGVDYLLSGHIGMGVEKDQIAVGIKGFLATTKMDIKFKGVSSHAGASPEYGRNALLAAASCALNLHTLPQFGTGMSRVNVGTLTAGSGRNVVPDLARMEIEIRGENETVIEMLQEKVDRVIQGSAQTFGVEVEVSLAGGAPAYSDYDREFAAWIRSRIEARGIRTVEGINLGGSEDVAYMMNDVERQGGKSIYMIFGTPLKAQHHNSRFDFEESVLGLAVDTYTDLVGQISGIQKL